MAGLLIDYLRKIQNYKSYCECSNDSDFDEGITGITECETNENSLCITDSAQQSLDEVAKRLRGN